MTEEERKSTIEALLHERAGYLRRDLTGRVELVDRRLAQLDYPSFTIEGATPRQRAERRPRAKGETR